MRKSFKKFGNIFPSLFKITDKIHIYFGILVHQGHTKIIIINIAIAVIILNNQTIVSNMMMMILIMIRDNDAWHPISVEEQEKHDTCGAQEQVSV